MNAEEKEICRQIHKKAEDMAILMLEAWNVNDNIKGSVLYGLGEIKAMAAGVTGEYHKLLEEK